MHQIKIFMSKEGATGELESEVNQWIRETGARVIQITGNISPQTLLTKVKDSLADGKRYAPSDVMLVVLYES